jgi:hypothetical protein
MSASTLGPHRPPDLAAPGSFHVFLNYMAETAGADGLHVIQTAIPIFMDNVI